jgi:serine/threonine-protein kinase
VLIDDLQRWLEHRPVSVRGDDWQHRARLWLRRNAWAAGAASALALALSAGLAVSVWQWQRAEAAARASDNVTAYLSDLLKSASPDTNGGTVPTVTQLLETSRKDLATRFADDPATLDRLTEVLSETYVALNRSDLALPLARQRVDLAAQLQGPDGDRSLLARLELARILSQLGAFDEVVALAEPLRQTLPRRFGVYGDRHRTLLYLLAYGHGRLGHFAQAEAALDEAGRVTEAMFPPGDFQRIFHLNHVQVLQVTAGRLREGLAALKQTEPFWDQTPPDQLRSRHTLERNLIAVKIRLGDYGDVIARGQDLLPRIDALMGPGSDQATGLRAELARALSEMGRFEEAWLQRKAVLDTASTMAARSATQALPAQAQALLARALARPAAAPALRQQARALLAELQSKADQVGLAGVEARVALLRAAQVLADLPLALQTLASLRDDPRLARHLLLRARIDQLEAWLARWQDDLPRSRELLSARAEQLLGQAETRTPGAWSIQLDLACTLLDLHDPAAAAVLQRAALSRPDGMPAQVPLDLLQQWLQARLKANDQAGDTAPVAVGQAWDALTRRVGLPADAERAAVLAAALL